MKFRLVLRKGGKDQADIRMTDAGIERSMLNPIDADRVRSLQVGGYYIDSDGDKWTRIE